MTDFGKFALSNHGVSSLALDRYAASAVASEPNVTRQALIAEGRSDLRKMAKLKKYDETHYEIR